MRGNMKRGTLIAALLAAAAAAGCAQDVGDIDRTEPNRVRKSEITEGSWWMHQKVVEVPGESLLEGFEGLMMDTDKVVFVAEEHYLIAYRSYPHMPGADDQALNTFGDNNYEELYGADYKGAAVALYPIASHFDVIRQYDAATGEQSNVIYENTTDRPWYERDYMRVEWNKNPKANFMWSYIYEFPLNVSLSYQEVAENDPVKAPYFEYDDNGTLVYFDTPTNYIVELPFWRWNYGGWLYDIDAGAVEVRVVTSFAKDLNSKSEYGFPGGKSVGKTGTKFRGVMNTNYEPLDYPNQDMNRFGFFRTERYTYDPKLGMMDAGRIELANRHNIWERAYDDNGNLIPVNERQVRTIPYYIWDGVNEDRLMAMSEQVIDEWNVTFKRAVHLIRNPNDKAVLMSYNYRRKDEPIDPNNPAMNDLLAGEQDIFVACHVPVRADDNHEICGDEGYVPREGDMRKNFLWLVNQRQDVGLLGYCPSVVDPLTGQTFSAQAHVYTAPMNEMAQEIIQQIKFAKGELTPQGVRDNDANIAMARESRERFIELSKMSDQVRAAKINNKKMTAEQKRRNLERTQKVAKLQKFNYAAADAKLQQIVDSGLLRTDLDSDALRYAAIATGRNSISQLSDEMKEAASPFNRMSFTNRSMRNEIKKGLGAKGFCFKDDVAASSYDIQYSYLMDKYKDRNDYDNIFYEIRADIFRATALHEMGHGFGLRHNHSGSFDSMNYFNKYWELRGKNDHNKDPNFWNGNIDTIGKMYKLYDYSDEMLRGGLLINMYSSIMDYSSGRVDDHSGLGKYDHAAILYGYSAGATRTVNGIEPQKGLVEVFSDGGTGNATRESMGRITQDGKAGAYIFDILKHKDTTGVSTFDDSTSIGQNYLELVHFRDIFKGMSDANFDFINNRRLERMDNFIADKNSGNPQMVRVPYLFCTDDNRGALRSCHVFDAGADYMEQFMNLQRNYETNYWFRDFARGRALWSTWNALGAYDRIFFMLSDFFQSWYVGDRKILEDVLGDDRMLQDSVDDAAINSTFNFFSKVIATPEYGLFCKRKDNGQLFNVADGSEAREEVSEFYRRARCGRDSTYYYVPQGEGRNRFGKYDVNAGFDYSWYELEAEHLYTSIWAIQALFDNEATVIVDAGDMNTYVLGLYDYFTKESIDLVDSVLSEDYTYHSPLLITSDGKGGDQTITSGNDESFTGTLLYPAPAKAYAYDENGNYFEYDPLTGMTDSEFAKYSASVPLFGVCNSRTDCLITDAYPDMECLSVYRNQETDRCYAYFDSVDVAKCPEGTVAEAVYSDGGALCLPDDSATGTTIDEIHDNLMASLACTRDVPGYCADGKACVDGKCINPARRVESDTALSQSVYMTLYPMFLTGYIGMDHTLYDNLYVYREGSGQTNTPAKGYEAVKFEDPFTGEVYVANRFVCEPNADGSYPAMCYNNNHYFTENGAVKLIERGQKLNEDLEYYWSQVIELSDALEAAEAADPDNYEQSEPYQQYIDAYYTWYMTKYQIEDVVRSLNLIRNIYDIFGVVF